MPLREDAATAGVIAAGGALGSVARYELARHVSPAADGLPVATVLINVVGSFLLGALVVAVTDVWRVHRWVRPALGTGVLGGFTTFSTFALDARGLTGGVAPAYVAVSLVGSVAAAALGAALVRAAGRRAGRPADHGAPVDPLDPDLP